MTYSIIPPLVVLLAAACASAATTPAPQPAAPTRHAPIETVTVAASQQEATRRLVSILTAEGSQLEKSEGLVLTTAPVHRVGISSGSGRYRATGEVAYFYRATVAGDTASTLISLAMWGRMTHRVGVDPESPARETPITDRRGGTAECSRALERMQAVAARLRGP